MTKHLNTRVYIISALTLATAVIHLLLGFQFNDTLFLLNGVGYIVLLIALYFIPALSDSVRNLVRWAFILYTAVTIVLYFVINPTPFGSIPGLVTKVIEVALIVFLWLDRGN